MLQILLLSFLGITSACEGQPVAKQGINELIESINLIAEQRPVEKLHLQFDKPWYSVGDTIWFKAYLFEATYLTASATSGILYIELVNDSNVLIKRMMLPVISGLSWGNIFLDGKELSQGSYTLRAYTNWMRNFGEDYFFKKPFYVSQPSEKQWLVNVRTDILKQDGKDVASIKVRLNKFDNQPLGSRTLSLKFMEGKRVLNQGVLNTSAEGLVQLNVNLPDRNFSGKPGLFLQDLQKGETSKKIFIPFSLNRPDHIDLQFMPESGSMVNGFSSKIGFKAIGEDGRGTDISGIIYNNEAKEVTSFKSLHKGMGSFNVLPVSGETYTAVVNLPDGSRKTYPLPQALDSGIIMKVLNSAKADSLVIILACSPSYISGQQFYFLGRSRGTVCWGAAGLLNQESIRFAISKNAFPTGIARFTLLNAQKQPVSERVTFINHEDNLQIKVTPNKAYYQQRDSITLNIQVNDFFGNPMRTSLSLAVTDDNQVTTDSILENSIISNLLLASDLKGTVEDPGYYFQGKATSGGEEMDALMLTQGWRGQNLPPLAGPLLPPDYKAEQQFSVIGRVTNVFNKPVTNAGVILLSQKSMLVKDTATNDSGIFTFNNIYPTDTDVFLLQARNKKGKSFNVGIEVDEFKPPVFSNTLEYRVPWYINIDTARLANINNEALFRREKDKLEGKSEMLAEVIVRGKKIIPDSKNLNGGGEADLTLTESDLKKAGKQTLGMLLEKNIKGFGLGGKTGRDYMVYSMLAHIIIDGVNLDFSKPEGVSRQDHFKSIFDYYTAEDIKGIEVMRTGKYQMSYTSTYLNPLDVPWDHAFIEITTYGGQGPFLKKTPGVYLYRPLTFSQPAQFYVPKYNIDSSGISSDIRSTIHWEPNITTNDEGKATVSFYSADHAGFYTIIIEGSDMNGNLGESRRKLEVRMR